MNTLNAFTCVWGKIPQMKVINKVVTGTDTQERTTLSYELEMMTKSSISRYVSCNEIQSLNVCIQMFRYLFDLCKQC